MTREYLKSTDEGAFLDLPVKERRTHNHEGDEVYMCPTCLGHGGWHLALNEYGEGKHFNCWCDDCNSWGWINVGEERRSVVRQRIFDLFKPVLKSTGGTSGYAHRSANIVLTDKSLANHPDLRAALIYCADGWWSHNFGGEVRRVDETDEGIFYRVKVYTD